MKKMILVLPILIAMIWVSNPSSAGEDDPLLNAIKARQSVMSLREWNAEPLFAMAKGEIEYDAEFAAALANNLKAELAMNNDRMWPEGTHSDTDDYFDETAALPENWSDYPAAADAGKVYVTAINALAEQAGNGLDALRSTIGDVGDSCQGCHDDFREE
jgi:cytochrome c556